MYWLNGLQYSIDYIEQNITQKLDYKMIAKQSFMSEYHFQRVFSALLGISVGEYIRKRRMTLAGIELCTENVKIVDVAMKYGYDNPDSFSRAFEKFHDIKPSYAKQNKDMLKSYSKITVSISFKGGDEMRYQVVEIPEFFVCGCSKVFSGLPINKQRQQHDFMIDGDVRFVRYAMQGLSDDCVTEYCVVSDVEEDKFLFTVGSEINNYYINNLEETIGSYAETVNVIKIPKHLYIKAQTECGYDFMDDQENVYKKIIEEWLPGSGYILSDAPEITVIHKFHNSDEKKNSYAELLIPVEKSKNERSA